MSESLSVSVVTNIAAPVERVWRALVEFERYAAWHPALSLHATSDETVVGTRLEAHVSVGTAGTEAVSLTLVEVDAPHRLAWEGGLPGVLMGRHSFVLEPRSDGTTEYTDSEEFSGSAAAETVKRGRAQLEDQSTRYSAALKAWVEAR
jgi:uncharacterized protein YndB with AHSA1/START domain